MDHLTAVTADPADHVALIEAIVKDRSRPAFGVLFDAFAPKLNAYYRKGGVEGGIAEDLVQEVMLTVWRLADRYRPELGSPSTWIFTIARNRLIDHVRRERVRRGDLSDPTLQPEPMSTADDLIDRAQRYRSLKAAVETLPKEQSDMLKMAFFDHKPHSAIAAESGLPLGTVKSRIRLALKRLRDEFAETLRADEPGDQP
jgi:RNA polymerase sigma-70 factor (ECF subfamily)